MSERGGVLIDTSCWIEAMRRRGNPEIRERVIELTTDGRARLADIIRLELWNGVGGDPERRFLGEIEGLVETVPTTDEVWNAARAIARRARQAGVSAQAADLLIFACANVHALELFHRDAHFDHLSKL